MIEEQIFPSQLELILRVRSAKERCQRRIFLGVEHEFFVVPNSLFRARLRSVDAAVIFKIKFVLPSGNFEIWKLELEVGEEIFGSTEINLWKNSARIAKAICLIEHRPGRPAAMVADSVQIKHLRRIGNFRSVNRWRIDREV